MFHRLMPCNRFAEMQGRRENLRKRWGTKLHLPMLHVLLEVNQAKLARVSRPFVLVFLLKMSSDAAK